MVIKDGLLLLRDLFSLNCDEDGFEEATSHNVWKGEEMEAGSGEEKGGAEEVAAWRQIRGVDGGRDVNGNEGGTCRGWGVGEREGGGGRGVGQQLEAWRGSTEMCGTCCSRYVDNVLM